MTVSKGSIMRINHPSGLLAVDTNNEFLISDYFIDSAKISKLNIKSNWRFYANFLINSIYSLNYIDYSFRFDELENFANYNVVTRLEESKKSLNRSYHVTNCKLFVFLTLFFCKLNRNF